MSVRRKLHFTPPRPIYSNISWQFTDAQIKDEMRLHTPTDSFPKLFRLLADLAPKLVIKPAIEITDNVAYLAVKRNLSSKEFVIEVENLLAEVIDNSNYLSRFKITADDSRTIAKQVSFILLNHQETVLWRIKREAEIPTDAKSNQIKWNAWWEKTIRPTLISYSCILRITRSSWPIMTLMYTKNFTKHPMVQNDVSRNQ